MKHEDCHGNPHIFSPSVVSSKVLIDLFQKVAVSKDGVFGRAPQSAKRSFGIFFLPSFFFCAFCIKRKSGQTQTESFTEDEEHPLRRCLTASATAAGVRGFTRCNGFLELSTDGK